MRAAGPPEREMAAFADRVFNLIDNGQPVRLYTGCGTMPSASLQSEARYSVWPGNLKPVA